MKDNQSEYQEKLNALKDEYMPYTDWLERETELISGREYNAETINIDGKRFLNCKFNNCRLTYSAFGAPGGFDECSFNNAKFEYTLDAFRSTIAYLKANANMRKEARLKRSISR